MDLLLLSMLPLVFLEHNSARLISCSSRASALDVGYVFHAPGHKQIRAGRAGRMDPIFRT
jgi:hypothetical protein